MALAPFFAVQGFALTRYLLPFCNKRAMDKLIWHGLVRPLALGAAILLAPGTGKGSGTRSVHRLRRQHYGQRIFPLRPDGWLARSAPRRAERYDRSAHPGDGRGGRQRRLPWTWCGGHRPTGGEI